MEFEDFDISGLKRKNHIEENLTKIFKNVKQFAQNISHDYETKNYDIIEHDMDVLTATVINVNEFLKDKENLVIQSSDGSFLNYLGEEITISEENDDSHITMSELDYIENIMALNRKIESQSFSLDELKQINTENQETENKPEDSESNDEWDF